MCVCVPVGACRAELGMVALSRGTELVSGSGVLLVGEVGMGLGGTRGFLWKKRGGRERWMNRLDGQMERQMNRYM